MAQSAGNGTVLLEMDARGVATVTLNRPQVNNAYNGDLLRGLHEVMDQLGTTAGLRMVVLKGRGKHFQAGADLAWIRSMASENPQANLDVSRLTAEAVRRLDLTPVPTLALIQGGCFGGGVGVAAACDVVVAADDAVFAITETRWGLMPGIIIPHLCRAIGVRQVRRYAQSGERFDARRAQAIGLAHEVCPLAELETVGERIVDAMLMNAPGSTAATKARTLQHVEAAMTDALFAELVDEHARFRQQTEAREGTAAFLEKRAPSWYPGSAR
jgi:methylglutaconyl-CoA hydratase